MSEFTDKVEMHRHLRLCHLNLFHMVQKIKDALGTAEDGDALIEVARNAHRAEMEWAAFKKKLDEAGYSVEGALACLDAVPYD